MNLTEHFTLEELTVTDTGISNIPDPSHQEALLHLAEGLENIRANALHDLPVHVDSAYRSPAVNAAVGGVPNSAHEQGHAADITCPTIGPPLRVAERIQEWLDKTKTPFDQVIFEENAWVHVSFQNTEFGQRGQYLTFDGTTYTDGIHAI